jgi:hypothetical protein
MKSTHLFLGALAIVLGQAYATEVKTQKIEDVRSTHPLKGVTPSTLKIGDRATKQEFCANIVEIIDATKACKKNKCLRPFSYENDEGEKLTPGMRAISVTSCEEQKSEASMLLWGPENLLLLKTDRKLEKGLWEQSSSKKTKSITFTTEASSGTLTLKSGKFTWTESE